MRPPRTIRLIVFVVTLVLVAGCSSDGADGSSGGDTADPSEQTTGFEEPTMSGGSGEQTTAENTGPESTLGASPEEPDLVLRFEGDPKTRFFGRCTDGGQETVLKGRVPRRYAYNLAGGELRCRIQKQGAGGSLKVILTAGNTTRSVQQVNASGAEINISYKSSG